MSFIVKRGVISHLEQSTNFTGSNGNVRSSQSYTFRLDNLAAVIQTSTAIGLTNGDSITAVGLIKNGALQVYTMRNDTTGVSTKTPSTFMLIFGICLTLLGLMTFVFLIGFAVLPIGIYFLVKSYKMKKANELLQQS